MINYELTSIWDTFICDTNWNTTTHHNMFDNMFNFQHCYHKLEL